MTDLPLGKPTEQRTRIPINNNNSSLRVDQQHQWLSHQLQPPLTCQHASQVIFWQLTRAAAAALSTALGLQGQGVPTCPVPRLANVTRSQRSTHSALPTTCVATRPAARCRRMSHCMPPGTMACSRGCWAHATRALQWATASARATSEVCRALKPGGKAPIMICHQNSIVGHMRWFCHVLLQLKPFALLTTVQVVNICFGSLVDPITTQLDRHMNIFGMAHAVANSSSPQFRQSKTSQSNNHTHSRTHQKRVKSSVAARCTQCIGDPFSKSWIRNKC